MLKRIKVNLELLEQMIYFWKASSENEKVAEDYLANIAAAPELAPIYDSELDAGGVRMVLSAITNRERMSDANPRQWKFWNNNMWVMEDMGILESMVRPIKVLNADELVKKVNARRDFPFEEAEVIFIPGTGEEYMIDKNRLTINFFKLSADLYDEDKVTIEGVPVLDYIEDKLMLM